MLWAGILLGLAFSYLSLAALGDLGIILMYAILFGMVWVIYLRNKQIHADLQLMKEKLELLTPDEKMEIEIVKASRNPYWNPTLNKEIEEELEQELSEREQEGKTSPPGEK